MLTKKVIIESFYTVTLASLYSSFQNIRNPLSILYGQTPKRKKEKINCTFSWSLPNCSRDEHKVGSQKIAPDGKLSRILSFAIFDNSWRGGGEDGRS